MITIKSTSEFVRYKVTYTHTNTEYTPDGEELRSWERNRSRTFTKEEDARRFVKKLQEANGSHECIWNGFEDHQIVIWNSPIHIYTIVETVESIYC